MSPENESAANSGNDEKKQAPSSDDKTTPNDVHSVFDIVAELVNREHQATGRQLTWAELEGRGLRDKVIAALGEEKKPKK